MTLELRGQSYISTESMGPGAFQRLIDFALEGKANPEVLGKPLLGKSVGLVFFNSSLRTRSSMAVAIHQLGGYPLILDVSSGVWNLETELGVKMLGDRPEHIKEAMAVLSRYVDVIGVRCFAKLQAYKEDRKDSLMKDICEFATVPVINLESAMYHPCQSLADMMTIKEKLGAVTKKKIVLSWAPHPKPLPMAVANSFALAACQLGGDVWVASPEGYNLDPELTKRWSKIAESQGGTLNETQDQDLAFKDAKVIYAKSWGSLHYYGDAQKELEERKSLDSWLIDGQKMALTDNGAFMHCLPVRRNVVVTDEVIDGPHSVVIDQAENRLHGQKAVLAAMLAKEG